MHTFLFLSLSQVVACKPGKTAPSETPLEANGNFAPDHIVQVDITMSAEDWDALRQESRSFVGEFSGDCMAQPFTNDYTTFTAAVSIDGQLQPTVGIRKKGFIGSQSTEKPSLKINIDEYIEGAELFGVDNVTLNNAVQDPALIRQCLAYDIFAQAGYPAPRCNFAHVWVNGRNMGIYAHVEPVKASFLRSHFGNDDGDLYEGTVSDFREQYIHTFEAKTLTTDSNKQPLQALLTTLADEQVSLSAIEEHLDLDQFFTFWALESIVGHWDGYNGNRNNFYLYRDPSIDKLVFIPWGLDDSLDIEAVESPPFAGSMLAHRLLNHPDGASRFEDRLNDLLDQVWDENLLLAEVDRIETMLGAEIDLLEYSEGIDNVRSYIENRRSMLTAQLPGTTYDLPSPACLVEKATLEASFETQWGTLAEGNPMTDGDIQLQFSWEGNPVPFATTGVLAGLSEEESPTLMKGGVFRNDNGGMIISYLELDPQAIEDGTPLASAQDGIVGGIYYTETAFEGTWIFMGYLVAENLLFDSFSMTTGDTISGELAAKLLTWEEYE